MKRLLNRTLHRLSGYRLTKGPIMLNGLQVEHDFLYRHRWIQKLKFATIIDIGANMGQFAARFRVLFPEAMIYSFEPIPEVFDRLTKRFESDLKFKAFNLGLGKEAGSIDFHQNEFSDSSSALPMKDLHKDTFPQTRNEKIIQVPIERLDQVMGSMDFSGPTLVKIDVQGFEEMVIAGGKETLAKADMVIVEVSFYELYENQVSFHTIYERMKSLSFTYKGNYEQLLSPKDGSILQADAIFVREK